MSRLIFVVVLIAPTFLAALSYADEARCDDDTSCIELCLKEHPTWTVEECEAWLFNVEDDGGVK